MNFLIELARSFSLSHDACLFMWMLAGIGCAACWVALERWRCILWRTDYDSFSFFNAIRHLIAENKYQETLDLCAAGGGRILPSLARAAVEKAMHEPSLVVPVLEQESLHATAILERRLNFLVMFGNVSTLFGLLGTVYGLIMSFYAVSKPEIATTEKSSLLAAGISTAMNSTLVGLLISVACVMAYSFLRTKVEGALTDMDRYRVALCNVLNAPTPKEGIKKSSSRSHDGEEHADADVTPLLNLMVILIPVLLTSSEFVKIGAIDLTLPEASAAGGDESSASPPPEEVKLDLGVAIMSKGFTLFHYFKPESNGTPGGTEKVDIPLSGGEYDFVRLTDTLASIKRRVVFELVKPYNPGLSAGTSLHQLFRLYVQRNRHIKGLFPDWDAIKIVAEDKVPYQTVVSVMDAGRSIRTEEGPVELFPNVSIAGGILQ